MTDKQQIHELDIAIRNIVKNNFVKVPNYGKYGGYLCDTDISTSSIATALYNKNYRRVADDEIVVKKRDRVNVFAEEFEELIRKDTANEIFTKLIEVAKNNDNKISIGLLKAWAIEYDVEVNND